MNFKILHYLLSLCILITLASCGGDGGGNSSLVTVSKTPSQQLAAAASKQCAGKCVTYDSTNGESAKLRGAVARLNPNAISYSDKSTSSNKLKLAVQSMNMGSGQ